ncbi:MAG: J domain-containing protein [Proteobacteria bacterium]|nr:J domain-containing protein [Pseudomonadota bacterium]MBU1582830.1 J domain-containing protein [Pseudomonadota bacterium]MBU2451829.1 J domain-containing protein [Pseudomonadota bacterium]MBU2631020.1 J domain-containing protein [Pseudomonadota bacterium]
MYIAYKKNKKGSQYILRESYTLGDQLTFRDLFDLGSDPSKFIKYAGHNAFYFDETIQDALSQANARYDSDELETLFWPWIRPDIKRAIDTFRNRSSNRSSKKLSDLEKEQISGRVHSFDKRRAHYLKFGTMDQGAVENMPVVLFKDHVHQSRDEIEQHFLKQEFALNARELKTYVYTVFDLQRFFSSMLAKKMPHALDQEKVDDYFLKEICRLNLELFNKKTQLDDYMIRYVFLFFDHPYADTTLLDDFARAFMSRHRVFRPKPQKSITTQNACKIFNITKTEFGAMTKKHLTKLYRRLARQVHPDTGGSHEKFVELNTAYEILLENIK